MKETKENLFIELKKKHLQLHDKQYAKVVKGESQYVSSLEMHLDWLCVLNAFEVDRIINNENIKLSEKEAMLETTRILRQTCHTISLNELAILGEMNRCTQITTDSQENVSGL